MKEKKGRLYKFYGKLTIRNKLLISCLPFVVLGYFLSKSGKYKAVSTIKKGSTVSYINKKLTSKKTYYYKVRAYRTENGKRIYSSYSKAKSAKIK